MLKSHRKWIRGIVTAAIAIALVGGGAAAYGALLPNPASWALTDTQVAQARQALLLTATQSDPSATAGVVGRVTGGWPSNIDSGVAFGTDRGAANTAMGEPKAVSGAEAQHEVVCAEAHGQFTTANQPHPPGAQLQTYSYAVVCFDPATGAVTDTGYDNTPISSSFSTVTKLDVTSAITQTVN